MAVLCRRLPLTSTRVWSADRPRSDTVLIAKLAPAPLLEVLADGTRVEIRSRVDCLPLLVSSAAEITSIGAMLSVTVREVERVPVTISSSMTLGASGSGGGDRARAAGPASAAGARPPGPDEAGARRGQDDRLAVVGDHRQPRAGQQLLQGAIDRQGAAHRPVRLPWAASDWTRICTPACRANWRMPAAAGWASILNGMAWARAAPALSAQTAEAAHSNLRLAERFQSRIGNPPSFRGRHTRPPDRTRRRGRFSGGRTSDWSAHGPTRPLLRQLRRPAPVSHARRHGCAPGGSLSRREPSF
jgi:hypothetical protein